MREELKELIAGITGLALKYQNGEYRFDHGRALEFSYDVAEYFEKEPGLLKDDEIKKLLNNMVLAMTPFIKSLFNDFHSLEMTFMDARETYNNKDYFWLYMPENLMAEKELKEWKKYLKSRGYK